MVKPDYWERRGSQIYTEGNGEPGNSELVAELYPLKAETAEVIVRAHNETLDSFVWGKR